MKKTNVKEIEFQKDQYGMTMYTSEYALSMIANTISNLEHGISRISVDNNVSDETDLRGVEEKLDQLCGDVTYVLGEIRDEISASNTNDTLELILMQLSRIADSLENKK